MKILSCLLSVVLVCAPVFAGEGQADGSPKQEEFPAQFMKLEPVASGGQKLSTPVVSYVNEEGQEVALIGAVHVADPAYYARLNQLFRQYDLLLFEMIGGEGLQRQEELRRKLDRSKPLGGLTLEEAREWNRMMAWRKKHSRDEMSFLLKLLGKAYQELSEKLDLQTQHDGIDYSPAHFIHADMTVREFREAQARKGESFAKLMIKSVLSSAAEKPARYRPNELKMLTDLVSGNTVGLKNEVMRSVASSSLEELEDTVILEGRNARCLEILDQWREKGHRRIGIFYGAAHLPGLHHELLKRGYHLKNAQWLSAWSTER